MLTVINYEHRIIMLTVINYEQIIIILTVINCKQRIIMLTAINYKQSCENIATIRFNFSIILDPLIHVNLFDPNSRIQKTIEISFCSLFES